MAAEGMQSHDQSCGNCPTASHPATKKGRINAPILPKPARRAKSDRLLAQFVERMPPVAGERPHLAGPAPNFASLRPFAAHQDMRAVDLIDSAIARAGLFDPLFLAANADDERLALDAGDGVHARNF